MSPHWPSPLVTWILAGWTFIIFLGVAVRWWTGRPTRKQDLAEDVAAWKAQNATVYRFDFIKNEVRRLPARSGVNAMFEVRDQ